MKRMTKSVRKSHSRGLNNGLNDGLKGLYTDLDFDDLESRVMLAGDVTAVLDGGTLTITGDGEGNALRLDQVGDTVVVSGLFDAGNVNPASNTTINGLTSAELFQGVTNLVVNLGGGDDILLLGQDSFLELDGDLNIDMSTGNDIVVIGTGNNNGEKGDNGDYVALLDEYQSGGFVNVGGEANISLGSGDDTLFMEDVEIGTEPNQNALRIFAGSGSDGIDMRNVILNEDLLMELGAGDDIVNAVNVQIAHDVELFGEAGNDYIQLNNVSVGVSEYEFTPDNADIDLGSGDDSVVLVGPVTVQDRLRVIGGEGTDFVVGTAFANVLNGPVEIDAEVIFDGGMVV